MCRVPIYQNVFLQQPRICAGCLFTKLLDILDYRQPSCRQENTEEMLMFISSLQPGCQPCFSFAERNNLRLFFPSLPCFSCSAPKLSPLRNFSLAENMRILFFFAYCLYSLIFVFLKEDCFFISGFVENWRFSVDVWQQELWAFGLRQRSRVTLRWSEEDWVGWEQWRRRRTFIPIGDVGMKNWMESSKKREEHSSQFSLGFCGVGVAEMRCPDKISQFERLWCLHSLHSPACLGLLRPSQTVVLWLKETFSPLLLWKRGGGAYCFIVTYFQGKTQNLSLSGQHEQDT